MPSRIRPPQEIKIQLPTDDDWILVKQHLTWGEFRDSEVRMFKSLKPGSAELDPAQAGISLAIAYLLDWSLLDMDGNPIAIRRQPPDVITSAFRAIDDYKGAEIMDAVMTHHAAMTAATDAQKKTRHGEIASPVTSDFVV